MPRQKFEPYILTVHAPTPHYKYYKQDFRSRTRQQGAYNAEKLFVGKRVHILAHIQCISENANGV
jgi:hypothetical protein